MKKRILSLLLALLMLLSMVPVSAIAEGNVDYYANKEKKARFLYDLNVSAAPEQEVDWSSTTRVPLTDVSDLVVIIDDCKILVEQDEVWYKVRAQEGETLPEALQDMWIFHDTYSTSLGATIEFACGICDQFGCTSSHENWCEICKKDDCGGDHTATEPTEPEPTDPSEPDNSCACCESCTGAEGCQCLCGECDFCQPEEEPERPTLTHPTGVEVTAESFPEGVSLTVQEVSVSSQLNKYQIPESKQVFGLDISLLNADSSIYQPGGALVKVPVSAPVGTKIGIIHDHNGNISFIDVTQVLSDGTVEFYTDSFSTFAGFTVDFHYNGVDYSIEGLSSILLSDLFIAMGIEENAYAAKSVVFSDNTLVGVERQDDGNWLLTSLEAFTTNETLIITFNDDRTIVIDVTDPAWEPVYFSFPNSATTGITGHTKDNVVGSKTVTVILYDAVTGKELDRATNTKVNGNFYLELRSDNSKYWFEITEVGGGHVQFREKGLLDNYNAYTYTSKLDQYSVTFERTRTGSGTVTIKVNCYPTLITNSTNSEYCYVRRVTKMAATNDTQTRSLNIVVDRVGNNDTTVTYSNLLFPDRNGDGNGHGDVEADRDIAITGTAPGYKNATKTESGTTYIVTVNPITYTIVFNGNGNTSGSMSNQVFEYDVAQNLQSNGYSRAYQVSFDSSGGDAVAARTATATFNGWATSKTGAVKYTNGQSVEKLTTTDGKQVELFANWTLGSLTLPSTTKAGYTLEGWTDGTKTYAAGSSYTPTANVTLTAVWNAKTYKVTLDAQNGTGDSDGTTAYWYIYNTTKNVNGETVYYWTNAACTSPLHNYTITKPTKKGHTFGGYYTAVNGGGTQYVDDKGMCVNNLYAAVADNSTLHAKWTAKTFTVNYHSNGGSGSMDSHTVVYGNTIQIKNNAFTAPSGKRFAGWAVSATGNAGEHGWSRADKTGWSGTWSYDNGEYGIANDTLNLYAIWEADDRTVTWKNWNGDVLETDTVQYNGSATYDGAQPTRTDDGGYSYTFSGWDKGTNGTISNVTANTTVTAQYSKTPISYTASFDYNSGDEGVATKNFTVESALTLPKLTKTGYTGKWIVTKVEGNWTNGAEFASEGSVAAGKYGNVTFTAQWTPITYKIQFAGGEGGQGSMVEITATYDKDVTLPENQFQRIIKVTYDVNGGKNLDPSDTVVSLEATFKNWVYNSTEYKDQASVKNLASTQDAVVQMTAQWDLKSTTTPTVEKDGYTFGGWMEEGVATGTAISAGGTYTPTRDITLVAQWNHISYTITYDSNGGSAVEPTSYNIEQAVTLASAPTREGYKFDGWKLQTAGGNWIAGDYTADQIIGTGKYGNVTLVAQWKDQYRYVLNYNANTTDTVGNMPANVDSGWVDATKYTADLSATPTRANYDFMGWATSEDATAADVLRNCELQGIAHDTASATLYAVWQSQTGDLKLTFNGGETAPAIVTVSGQGKTITLVLTKAETVIKGLPTGEYSVAVESGNASYVASVRTNPNPKIESNQTAEVEITTGSKGLNWFTAFYWVKNKFGMQN